MPVSQVLLKVSPANDITQAVSVDVTSDILTAGKTIYNVGAASTTRWYFAVLTDDAGNSSTFPLGSYTTAAAALASLTIEANRALVTTDSAYVSGSAGTVSGTDVSLTVGQNLAFKLSSTLSGFTVGVRLKFANTTTFTNVNNNYTHQFLLKVYGSNNGATSVYFNLFNCTQSGALIPVGVRWDGRGSTRQLIAQPTAVMRTAYFWVFVTGTPGGAITFRSFDTDDTTLTASSTYSVNMPALVGDLQVQLQNSFNASPANTVTVDNVWYKPSVDTAVTPASTVS
jgi:hypothetical protein